MGELLLATGCADVDELSATVDGDANPDMWVEEADGGVEVGSGVRATVLAFPFLLAEFWAVVDEVEQQEVEHIESTHR